MEPNSFGDSRIALGRYIAFGRRAPTTDKEGESEKTLAWFHVALGRWIPLGLFAV